LALGRGGAEHKRRTWRTYPPSDKQIALVEKLAATNEEQPPAGWKEDAKKASTYIDACFKKSGRKGRKSRKR